MAPHTSYTPVGGMEYEEPVSRTYQYRKVMKPMLERKRRARINRCLDELKDLMVTALQAEGENVAKLEKADILELTVRHLHTLRAARRLTLTPENSYADRFREGFTQCAQEVSSFLSTPVAAAVHPAAGAQLMRHLGGCLRRLEGPANSVTNGNATTTNVNSVSGKASAVSPATTVMVSVPQNVYTPPQSPVSVASSSGESSESSNAVWRPCRSELGLQNVLCCRLYNLSRCYRLTKMDVIAYNHHEIASIASSIDGGDIEAQYEDEVEEILPYIDINRSLLTIDDLIVAGGEERGKMPFRRSLFSNVAPYIAFQSFDYKGPVLPYEVTRHLKWRLSTITPLIVRRTLVNSGYRLMKKSQEWCGTWGKHMKSICFKNLKESQKINHFPGTFQIGRKDRLWRNLSRMMLKHGKREFGFVPRTYVLPQDLRCFRQVWEKSGSKEKWIVKPPASARGTGIRVVHRWSQIPKKRAVVVQQYLSRPKLISGAKFDLRLYVLVTSFNPLKIYIYPDGLVRFASVKYNDDINYLSDRFMHLTNYSINKTSATYTSNDCVDSCTGHKWTLRTLWSYLEREHVNVSKLWASMKDIVVKTMIAGESSINTLTRANTTSRYCCYELFGVDILLDENLKPWLLEVNISPSLQSSSPLDVAIKGPLIKNVFNIAGYHLPTSLPAEEAEKLAQSYQLDTVCQDVRLHRTSLSYQERHKQSLYANLRNREDYLDEILEDLTPDDVRHLITYEDELTQLDRFERIFPTNTSHEYLQYFDVPRYYNMLFDAWEVKYGDDRERGISRLQKFCKTKYHLEQQVVS